MSEPSTGASRGAPWSKNETVSLLCRGLTLASFLFLVALTARAKQWIHPDCAMYLHTGELILDGQIPYVDFVEINPPLVMYLHALPVAIARALGASPVSVFNVMVSLLAGYGAWSFLRYLPHLAPRMSEPYRHVVANIWLGFSFLILIAGQWSFPSSAAGTDYGQREHFIVLGYVPLMLLRMVRWRRPEVTLGRIESLVVGALAGLVLCLKPHFIAAAALVEIHLLIENKRLRPLLAAEVYAACGVAIAYALHFAFVPTSMRAAFFDRWLPLASSRYDSYHWPWLHVFSLETLYVTALVGVLVWLPYREPYRAMARRAAPFATFAWASSLVMISQHKGWPYHLIPMAAGIYLTTILVAAEVMQHQVDETPLGGAWLARAQRALLLLRAPLFILLIGAWYGSVMRHSPSLFRRYGSETLDLVRQVTEDGDGVTYLTTAVQTVYPEAFHSKRAVGTRFLWTFPIAYLFEGRKKKLPQQEAYQVPAGREKEAEQLLSELSDDIHSRKPKLVFVWRGGNCQGCPPGFILATYLMRHGFRERALDGYVEHKQIGYWSVFARADVRMPAQYLRYPSPAREKR